MNLTSYSRVDILQFTFIDPEVAGEIVFSFSGLIGTQRLPFFFL